MSLRLDKFPSVSAAKKAAKETYGSCIFTEREGFVDGAHFFPAGPYPALKKYAINIFPMMRPLHVEFDKVSMNGRTTTMEERTVYILNNVCPQHRNMAIMQMALVYTIALKKGIIQPENDGYKLIESYLDEN